MKKQRKDRDGWLLLFVVALCVAWFFFGMIVSARDFPNPPNGMLQEWGLGAVVASAGALLALGKLRK